VTPLAICCSLGPLLAQRDSAGLSLSRRGGTGPWLAMWAVNLRGDPLCWASATSPEAAIEGLADALVRRGKLRAIEMVAGDEDDRDLGREILAALSEATQERAA